MTAGKWNSQALQLWFTTPGDVEVRPCRLSPPAADEVVVEVSCSAISAGTELLLYRGQLPADMALDATLESLPGSPVYPLRYGYAAVGRIIHLGAEVDAAWMGRRVFGFQPHASHFVARVDTLFPIPDSISDEAAVLFPNMETAVNLIQDGAPLLGERVVVLGQGMVGLLLTRLLSQFPLNRLLACDVIALRRDCALRLGAHGVFDPRDDNALAEFKNALQQNNGHQIEGADLIYEVSGSPHALNLAIDSAGFDSRIILGSWYGTKTAAIALGGNAHRNRISIRTSQVSTLSSALTGRWSKQRRYEATWNQLQQLETDMLISHRVPFTEAAEIYQQLERDPDALLQTVFIYR